MTLPVLLLHGFATSAARTWVEPGWVALLEDAGREVIALDLLGHGSAPKPTAPEAYADVEGAVLEQLPEVPMDAIGYSAGARILLVLAHQRPTLFNRIVLGGIGAKTIREPDEPEAPFEPHIQQRFEGLIQQDGNEPEALKAFRKRIYPPMTAGMAAEIQVPALVVIGDKDFVGPGEPLADALPQGKLLTLRGVDHFGLPKNFTFLEKALEFIGAQPL